MKLSRQIIKIAEDFQVECKSVEQILNIFKYYNQIGFSITLFPNQDMGLNTLEDVADRYFEHYRFIIIRNSDREVSGHSSWNGSSIRINFNDLFEKREKFDTNIPPKWE